MTKIAQSHMSKKPVRVPPPPLQVHGVSVVRLCLHFETAARPKSAGSTSAPELGNQRYDAGA
jgi:hypothetical protein